jgi:hypothetical protein
LAAVARMLTLNIGRPFLLWGNNKMSPTICTIESKMLEQREPTGSSQNGPAASGASSDWARLVAKIQRGDEDALAELYEVFARGVKFYMYRQLGPQDLEDRLHDTFLVVVQAIKNAAICGNRIA